MNGQTYFGAQPGNRPALEEWPTYGAAPYGVETLPPPAYYRPPEHAPMAAANFANTWENPNAPYPAQGYASTRETDAYLVRLARGSGTQGFALPVARNVKSVEIVEGPSVGIGRGQPLDFRDNYITWAGFEGLVRIRVEPAPVTVAPEDASLTDEELDALDATDDSAAAPPISRQAGEAPLRYYGDPEPEARGAGFPRPLLLIGGGVLLLLGLPYVLRKLKGRRR